MVGAESWTASALDSVVFWRCWHANSAQAGPDGAPSHRHGDRRDPPSAPTSAVGNFEGTQHNFGALDAISDSFIKPHQQDLVLAGDTANTFLD